MSSIRPGDAARFVGQPPVLEIRGRIDSTVKIRGFKVLKFESPEWVGTGSHFGGLGFVVGVVVFFIVGCLEKVMMLYEEINYFGRGISLWQPVFQASVLFSNIVLDGCKLDIFGNRLDSSLGLKGIRKMGTHSKSVPVGPPKINYHCEGRHSCGGGRHCADFWCGALCCGAGL